MPSVFEVYNALKRANPNASPEELGRAARDYLNPLRTTQDMVTDRIQQMVENPPPPIPEGEVMSQGPGPGRAPTRRAATAGETAMKVGSAPAAGTVTAIGGLSEMIARGLRELNPDHPLAGFYRKAEEVSKDWSRTAMEQQQLPYGVSMNPRAKELQSALFSSGPTLPLMAMAGPLGGNLGNMFWAGSTGGLLGQTYAGSNPNASYASRLKSTLAQGALEQTDDPIQAAILNSPAIGPLGKALGMFLTGLGGNMVQEGPQQATGDYFERGMALDPRTAIRGSVEAFEPSLYQSLLFGGAGALSTPQAEQAIGNAWDRVKWNARAGTSEFGIGGTRNAQRSGRPPLRDVLAQGDPRLTPTVQINTPERVALRDGILRKVVGQAQPSEDPTVYVMSGGGGSGKGFVREGLTQAGEIPANIPVVDPDEIKTALPEYRQLRGLGDKRAAAVVHEESSMLKNEAINFLVGNRSDFVLDVTLGDPKKGKRTIQALKDAGYKIDLTAVYADPNVAIQRAMQRAERTRRHVPITELKKAHQGHRMGLEGYLSLADRARVIDNTMESVKVYEQTPGSVDIINQEGYNSIIKGGPNEGTQTGQEAPLPTGTGAILPGQQGPTPEGAAGQGAGGGSEVSVPGGLAEQGLGQAFGQRGAVGDITSFIEGRRKIKGKISGAPPGVETMADVESMVNRFVENLKDPMADTGYSAFWYDRGGEAMRDVSQLVKQIPGLPISTEEAMFRLGALLSSSNQVGGNTTGMIKSIYQAANGEPIHAGRFPNRDAERIRSVLQADEFTTKLGGVDTKVIQFYNDLKDAANKYAGDGSTIDMWMYRLAGYPNESNATAKNEFMQNVVREVTDRYNADTGSNLHPREVQAALWSYVRNSKKGKVERGGFEDYINRATANITVEAIPSKNIPGTEWLLDAPYEVKRQYTEEAMKAIDVEGLMREVGIALGSARESVGGYEMHTSPNYLLRVVLPKGVDNDYQTRYADTLANALGYVLEQDAVPWYRLDPKAKGATKGLVVTLPGLTPGVADNFYQNLIKYLPDAGYSVDGDHIVLLNFGGMKQTSFNGAVQVATSTFGHEGATIDKVKSEGNYLDNDWTESPEGQAYKDRLIAGGSSALLEGLDLRREKVKGLQAQYGEREGFRKAGHRSKQRGSVGWYSEPTVKESPELQQSDMTTGEKFSVSVGAGSPAVTDVVNQITELTQADWEKAKRYAVPHADSETRGEALAEELGWNAQDVIDLQGRGIPADSLIAGKSTTRVLVGKAILAARDNDVYGTLSNIVDAMNVAIATRAGLSEVARALSLHGWQVKRGVFWNNILAATDQVTTQAKAALKAEKKALSNERVLEAIGGTNGLKQIIQSMKEQGDQVNLDAFSTHLMAIANGVATESDRTIAGKVLDMGLEYWKANILSGWYTHAVNISGNALNLVLENAVINPLAAVIGSVRGKGTTLSQYEQAQVKAWNGMMGDILAITKFAAAKEYPGKQLSQIVSMRPELAALAEHVGQSKYEEGRIGNIPGKAGRLVRNIGFTPLAIEDAVAKTIVFRMELAMQEAEGKPRDILEAIKEADRQTFNAKLDRFNAMWANIPHVIPGGGFVVPFTRTLANLVKEGVRLTPGLNLAMPSYRQDISGKRGATRQNIAISRMMVGMGLYALVSALHGSDPEEEGTLSGVGPAQAARRNVWFAAGNQPLGLKVGEERIPLYRFDPISTTMTLMVAFNDAKAAFTEYGSGKIEEKEFDRRVKDAAKSVSRAVLDKHFLSNVAGAMENIGDVNQLGRSLKRGAEGIATGFVPMSSMLSQGGQFTDPYKREQRTLEEKMKVRVPGMRGEVQHNLDIFGNKIPEGRYLNPLPTQSAPAKPNLVARELIRVGRGLSEPKWMESLSEEQRATILQDRYQRLEKVARYSYRMEPEKADKRIKEALDKWSNRWKPLRDQTKRAAENDNK